MDISEIRCIVISVIVMESRESRTELRNDFQYLTFAFPFRPTIINATIFTSIIISLLSDNS